MTTHYELLGVHRASTEEEVRIAFFKIAAKKHPDRGGDSSEFADYTRAYECLMNAKARRLYDNALVVTNPPCIGCGGEGFTTKQKGFVKREMHQCKSCGGSGVHIQPTAKKRRGK